MAEVPLHNEIKQRFGVLPNFFRLAGDTTETIANLWGFTQFAYLDNPLPSLFKERLFVYLSRFCEVRYCVARHAGFLVGLGYPAGDRDCLPQTVEQVLPLLQRPLPRGKALEAALTLCAAYDSSRFEFPSLNTPEEGAIFACATHVFLQTPDAPRAIVALRHAFSTMQLEFLNVFLAFVRMAHYWTQTHPELCCEEDINQLLATYETLSNCLLNDPEVEDNALSQQVLEEVAELRQLKGEHESLVQAYEAVSRENEQLPIERQERQRVEANLQQSKAQLEDERKQAKATLQESESRFRLALKTGKLGSWQLDLKTKELLTSAQCKANYGFSLDANFSHQALLNRIHPDDRAWVEAAIQQAIEQNSDYDVEYRNVWDDGSIHWALIRGCTFYESDGTPSQMHGMSLDITDRKRAEAALRESQERLQLALDASEMGTFLWHIQDDHGEMDTRMLELFGLTASSALTLTEILDTLIHPNDRASYAEAVARAIDPNGDGLLRQEIRVVHPDGSVRWLAISGQTFFETQPRRAVRMSGIAADITDRKLAEEQLRHAAEFNAFRITLTDVLRPLTDPIQIQAAALRIIGEHLQVDRVLYADIDEERDEVVIVDNYVKDGVPKLVGQFRISDFGRSSEILRTGGVICIADMSSDAHVSNLERESFGALGFVSLIGVPLVKDGRWVSSLGIHHFSPRTWREDDILFLQETAEQTWAAVEHACTEAALRQSEARFRRIFDCEMVPMGIWTISGEIMEANDTLLDLIGYTRQELETGQIDWRTLTPPEYWALDKNALSEIAIQGFSSSYEKVYVHKDGRPIPILVGAASFLDDLNSGVFFVIDLTDRKQAEAQLREAHVQLESALAAGAIYTWRWEIPEDLVIVNAAFAHLFGVDPEMAAVGLPIELFVQAIHEDDCPQVVEAINQAIKTGEVYAAEYRVYTADGEERWLSARGRVEYDADGRPLAFPGAIADITNRKTIEQEREQLLAREQAAREAAENANRIKDEFLAVLSHELRSPLNPILGWSSLLRKGRLDAGKTAYALETIERNAQLQVQLIEDLLDVSRILRGKLTLNRGPVNLATTIEAALETVQLAAEAKSIQIQTVFDPEVGLVLGDSARLQQVIWNLLTNAVKFTPEGGQVKIGLQRIGTHAQIQVRDTGKGIDPDFLPHVFEYFRQADSTTTRTFGGLGLGLAIVHHLVELHGGTVQVTSLGDGQGATFTVSLPLLKETDRQMRDELEDSSRLTPLSSPLAGLRVLLVDDDSDALDLITFMLEQSGAIVTAVTSVAEALQAFRQTRFDVLTSDIGMPGMDGYMLIRQIRAMPPEQGGKILAIALTAYAGELDQKQAISAGFQKHIAKPIKPGVLVKTIRNLVTHADT